jgi:hypothetical protein
MKPRIVIYDIENFPNVGYTWGKWEQNVIQFTRQHTLASFSWKVLGEKKVHVVGLPDFPSYKKDKFDDKELTKALWKLFDGADILIAHNGNSFDVKQSNAFFIKHNLPPPSAYQTIDTKLVAKRYFRFNSNKLDDLGDYFGLGRKVDTGGFQLWLDCMAGDTKAWKKMYTYNKQDVVLLEQIYLHMRPWMVNHPNVNAYTAQQDACPLCGSQNLQKRGFMGTRTGQTQRYQCQQCFAWSSGKTRQLVSIR